MEASPRLDRRSHHDELGAALGRDACDVLPEAPGTHAHDLAPHRDSVGRRDRRRGLEPPLEIAEPAVHVRVQRQLALDDESADEDDAGAPVGREPAGEVERVLGLLAVEQRHDDAAVGDRPRPAREAAGPPVERPEVGPPHRIS